MINPRGRPSRLLTMWNAREFELLLSDYQYEEIADVFGRSKVFWKYRVSPQKRADFFADLNFATRVVPSAGVPVSVRDSDDEQILAAALGGNADCLVTGDRDLLSLQDDPRLGVLRIVTVNQFLELLEQESECSGE
jgi:putative PIN family toxin of toxin-antitoxin system